MENDELLANILNPSCAVINISENNYATRLIKSQYNEHTDFLYLFRQYNAAHPLSIGRKPEYAGFVSYKNNLVYPGHYQMRELLKDKLYGMDIDSIRKQMAEDVAAEVQAQINNEPVAVSKEAEALWREEHDREYHLQYGAKSAALGWFYNRNPSPGYYPRIPTDNWSTEQVVSFVNDHDEFVTSTASHFIEKNANEINFTLWKGQESLREYKILEDLHGEHHLRRTIAECIHDEKKVTITLFKDEKAFEGKITTATLKNAANNYYSTYHLDASDRRAFAEVFGRNADIHAKDITKITYGKKNLYECKAE